MILSGEKFVEIYKNFGTSPSSFLTSYFKSYVDENADNPIFMKAMVTGYLSRCVEEICLKEKIVTEQPFTQITEEVQQIVDSRLTKEQIIKRLVEYFDDHDLLGLGNPIKPYTILPYDEAEHYFTFLIEDYINATYNGEIQNKISAEDYYEIILRNAAVGYYYRTSEELAGRL